MPFRLPPRFARILAESLIQAAIDYESGRGDTENAPAAAAGAAVEPEGAEAFRRTAQGTVGVGAGMVLFRPWAASSARPAAWPTGGSAGPRRALALLLAGFGFGVFSRCRSSSTRRTPPAVGNDATISERAGLHGVLVIAALLVAIVFPGFDPDLLYHFRLYSIGAQVLLWGVLALVFAPLAERVVGRADRGRPASERPSPVA